MAVKPHPTKPVGDTIDVEAAIDKSNLQDEIAGRRDELAVLGGDGKHIRANRVGVGVVRCHDERSEPLPDPRPVEDFEAALVRPRTTRSPRAVKGIVLAILIREGGRRRKGKGCGVATIFNALWEAGRTSTLP